MRIALLALCAMGSIGLAHAAAVKNSDPLPDAPKDACVFISNIQNWRVLDSRNVVIYAPNDKRAYLLQLGAPISDLKFAFKVAFIDNDRDGQLCGRSPDRVMAAGSMVRQPTLISGMTRLNDAGMQALEEKYGTQLTRKKQDKSPAQPEQAASPAT